MHGNPLTLGACVHSEQETSARILASSSTNPPRGRPHRPSERYPIVSSVFSASQRTGSLITNQTIEHVDAQRNQSIIGNR